MYEVPLSIVNDALTAPLRSIMQALFCQTTRAFAPSVGSTLVNPSRRAMCNASALVLSFRFLLQLPLLDRSVSAAQYYARQDSQRCTILYPLGHSGSHSPSGPKCTLCLGL